MELCGYCGFEKDGPLCGTANPEACAAASPECRGCRPYVCNWDCGCACHVTLSAQP